MFCERELVALFFTPASVEPSLRGPPSGCAGLPTAASRSRACDGAASTTPDAAVDGELEGARVPDDLQACGAAADSIATPNAKSRGTLN